MNAFEDTPHVCMDPSARYPLGWREDILKGKPLTDKKITAYEKAGFYSQAVRDWRKARQQKRQQHRRDGNFEINEGRLIYSPF